MWLITNQKKIETNYIASINPKHTHKMKISVIFGLIASLITMVIMYLDSRLLDNPKTKATYLKNTTMVGMIVGLGVYLVGESRFTNLEIFNLYGGSHYYTGSSSGLGEEIMTGFPDF